MLWGTSWDFHHECKIWQDLHKISKYIPNETVHIPQMKLKGTRMGILQVRLIVVRHKTKQVDSNSNINIAGVK